MKKQLKNGLFYVQLFDFYQKSCELWLLISEPVVYEKQ
jgi:hypothetical protein